MLAGTALAYFTTYAQWFTGGFMVQSVHLSCIMASVLTDLEETLYIPLWCRAQVSTQYPSLFYDANAVELVRAIDYDFSVVDAHLSPVFRLTSAARDRQCDDAIRAYVASHPRASVVNLGAGLDTAFYRVDNGLIDWYDLDLPDVIGLRERLFPATPRAHAIAKSILDTSWCDDVSRTDDGVFMVARAVLGYLNEGQVKMFFSALADNLPGAEVVFSACSKRALSLINTSLHRMGMTSATTQWALEDVHELTAWDSRVTLVEEIPFFSHIRRDPRWGEETLRNIDAIDERHVMRIVHVRV